MSGDPIAYAYDAAYHCPACAIARFGSEPGKRWPREDATDSEGNPVGALAPWDEWSNFEECEALACDTCGGVIDNSHAADCMENFGDVPCTIPEFARQGSAHSRR